MALLHHGDEPALYALLPDVVRALLAQLACAEPADPDSASQRRTIRLQAWRSLHALTSCVHNTSMDSSFASEADSEGSLLAGIGEAVGDFAIFGVKQLQPPSYVDAKARPEEHVMWRY